MSRAAPARHEVGIGKELGTGPRQPATEEWEALVAVAIFEALDQIAHGCGIARNGSRPIVDWGLGDRRC
jgi:hypothetical protein